VGGEWAAVGATRERLGSDFGERDVGMGWAGVTHQTGPTRSARHSSPLCCALGGSKACTVGQRPLCYLLREPAYRTTCRPRLAAAYFLCHLLARPTAHTSLGSL